MSDSQFCKKQIKIGTNGGMWYYGCCFLNFPYFLNFIPWTCIIFIMEKQISIIFKKKRRAHKGLRGMHGGSGVEGLGEAKVHHALLRAAQKTSLQ